MSGYGTLRSTSKKMRMIILYFLNFCLMLTFSNHMTTELFAILFKIFNVAFDLVSKKTAADKKKLSTWVCFVCFLWGF